MKWLLILTVSVILLAGCATEEADTPAFAEGQAKALVIESVNDKAIPLEQLGSTPQIVDWGDRHLLACISASYSFTYEREFLKESYQEMAHRDNEQNLAFSGLDLTDKLVAVRMEKDFSKVWVKRHSTEKQLDEVEFEKLNNYYLRWFTVMNTEWRMGRLTDESDGFYYRRKMWAILNSQCGQEFYIREGRNFTRFDRLRQLGDELYEELSGSPVSDHIKQQSV